MSVSDPITKVFLVTAKENLRASQNVVKFLSVTQRGHDADLYESSWRSKGKRYLCYEKDLSSDYVITDLLIVKDDEQVPNGFTGIFLTTDTDEKALKKHILCVKSEAKTTASKAVTDLMLINQSKGEKADPHFFTISHEVNEMNLTFRVDNTPQPKPNVPLPHSEPRLNEIPLHTAGSRTNSTNSTNPNTRRNPPLARSLSIARVTGIDGVPFALNPKFNFDSITNDPIMASVQILSVEDLNRKFNYDFNIENEAVRKM